MSDYIKALKYSKIINLKELSPVDDGTGNKLGAVGDTVVEVVVTIPCDGEENNDDEDWGGIDDIDCTTSSSIIPSSTSTIGLFSIIVEVAIGVTAVEIDIVGNGEMIVDEILFEAETVECDVVVVVVTVIDGGNGNSSMTDDDGSVALFESDTIVAFLSKSDTVSSEIIQWEELIWLNEKKHFNNQSIPFVSANVIGDAKWVFGVSSETNDSRVVDCVDCVNDETFGEESANIDNFVSLTKLGSLSNFFVITSTDDWSSMTLKTIKYCNRY